MIISSIGNICKYFDIHIINLSIKFHSMPTKYSPKKSHEKKETKKYEMQEKKSK